MALDPNVIPQTEPSEAPPALDYVVPAYRAVSPMAVVSLILGLSAILCFASLNFLAVSAAAIVTGLLAVRKIRRFPDMLTGIGLARSGVALGLIFAVASVTSNGLQYAVQRLEGSRFASAFADVLETQPIDYVVWYQVPSDQRKRTSPKQAMDELVKSAPDPAMIDMRLGTAKALKARIASGPGHKVEYEGLQSVGPDGLDVMAVGRYKVTGPTSERFPDAEQQALAVFKATVNSGRYNWRLEELVFPYNGKDAYTPSPAAASGGGEGGGHGHSH